MSSKKSIARVVAREKRAEEATRARLTKDAEKKKKTTVDSFVNFAQKMGVGADNPLTTASYGFNPITRIRTMLEWMYRGSWLAGVAVDVIAEDMTRAGVALVGAIDPAAISKIEEAAVTLSIWEKLCENIKWSRLYGGSIAVMLIDGQKLSTPLRIETVGKGQFKGLVVLDRWMVDPSLNDLVTTPGPDLGLPKFYTVVGDAPALPRQVIHHSRVFRMEGIQLPYWQRVQENLWGISVIERMYDRMIAFDSATTGAAQLVYKSYIRTYKVKGLRDLIAAGGEALAGLVAYVDMMRRFQGTEGITLLDGEDEFAVAQRQSFAGLDDIMLSFGEQISGSLQIPLVRLFGQSPKGMNATGESDLRTYYDGITKKQMRELLSPVTRIYRVLAQSEGIRLPDGFGLRFISLWQLSDVEKAEIGERKANAIMGAEEAGLITQQTALKELREQSTQTGLFTNITDADIEAASDELPPSGEEAMRLQNELNGAGDETGEGAESGPKDKPGDNKTPTRDDATLNAVIAMKAIHDLDVVIESKKGEMRKGTEPDGTPWEARLFADYGYVRRTTGADGDQVDVFIGSNHASPLVVLIRQRDLTTGQYDEDKAMLGYSNVEAALYDYSMSYSDGRASERVGAVDVMSMSKFKQWLAEPAQAYVL